MTQAPVPAQATPSVGKNNAIQGMSKSSNLALGTDNESNNGMMEMAANGCKWIEMARMTGNGYIWFNWLEMSDNEGKLIKKNCLNGWKWLETDRHDCKWLDMAGNC